MKTWPTALSSFLGAACQTLKRRWRRRPGSVSTGARRGTDVSLPSRLSAGIARATTAPPPALARAATSRGRTSAPPYAGRSSRPGKPLGGHTRRHRPITAAESTEVKKRNNVLLLDLNLPPPSDDN
ncbi:hypothetical protein BHM03_00021693 [Ensete ventricosum]|uniref:Uncharacterized protein n=1 Tax=Ensete ventricosum TaxID=4639 RepID=A0A445MG70_ENSVE|nr:hypothetical protein BHM03_00021693 [Ensete ventricosum]